MLKTIDIVLIAIMISAAAWTYKIKHEAEVIEGKIAVLERKIDLERETIALLEADWSLLNQPDRLQRLVETFQEELKLQPTQPHQYVDLQDLPALPVSLYPSQTDTLGGYAARSGSAVQ